jgi:hypothetical protein
VISILLRDLRGRLALVGLIFLGLLWWEVEARRHGTLDALEVGPESAAAPMAYLASLTTILLLAGFVSTDRREGYTRLFFAHPTSPLAFYALRWLLALGVAMGASLLFLLLMQGLVWGELRGGWLALLLPLLTAWIFGGLMAFLSSALPRGDAWVALALFVPTLVPQVLSLFLASVGPAVRQTVLFLLPPQTTALQMVYEGVLVADLPWGAVGWALGYGTIWLVLGVLTLRLREWP